MAIVSRLTLDTAGELERGILPPRKTARGADPPLDGVGQDLCRVRQRQGKELSDVSLVLKIRPHHLIAIEEGRFDVLPARVYAIGYVRSYAAYLGLDAGKYVDRLKAEMGARGGARDYAIDWMPLPTERKRVQSRTVVTALVVVAVVYAGYQVVASAGRDVEQPVRPVPERLLAEAGLTPKPVFVPLPAPVVAPAPILPPEPVVPVPTEIIVTPQVAAPAEAAPRVQAALPQGRRYGVQNRTSRITLRVHRPTYVAVQGTRNRVFIDRALFPGDTYRVPNVVGLSLTAQDGGAVEVILDGSSAGFAGDDGVRARALSLNPQAIVDRRQRG